MAISEHALMQFLRLIETSEALDINVMHENTSVRAVKGTAATLPRVTLGSTLVPVATGQVQAQPPHGALEAPSGRADNSGSPQKNEDAQDVAADEGYVVRSATAGTFYRSPSPGAPAFCNPGDQVQVEQTVCLVEVMKLFNSVPAGANGVLSKFFVHDGQPVERGQALALIK